MATPFSESKTRQNLMRSFVNETSAHSRYLFAAAVAEKERLHVVESAFAEIAAQEEAHARLFRGLLAGECGCSIPFDGVGQADAFDDTRGLLCSACETERNEQETLYPSFAADADAEGYPIHGQLWRMVAAVEGTHSNRFHNLAELLERDRLFEERIVFDWQCMNCGHIHRGMAAPSLCPLCRFDQGWFQRVIQ